MRSALRSFVAGGVARWTACAAGQFSLPDSDVCLDCPDRSNSTAGSPRCICDVGFAVNGSGVIFECSECPAGTISPDGEECTSCPANTYSLEGAGECFECPGNSTSVGGLPTCSCLPGYSTTGFADTLQCTSTWLSGPPSATAARAPPHCAA